MQISSKALGAPCSTPLSFTRGLLLALALAVALTPSGARAAVRVTSGLLQIAALQPGQSYQQTITVTNDGKDPQAIQLYQTDYTFSADGRTDYPKAGSLPRSNAGWIKLGQTLLTLGPGETVNLPYSVQVPTDRSLTGTYWSVIMVQPAVQLAPSGSSGGESKASVGLHQVLRYGVQVVTNVGDTGTEHLSLQAPQLAKDNKSGVYSFAVNLVNDGQRLLYPDVWIDLYDAKGVRAGHVEGQRLHIYPGTSIHQNLTLGSLTPGAYQALLVANNGDAAVYGARYNFKVP